MDSIKQCNIREGLTETECSQKEEGSSDMFAGIVAITMQMLSQPIQVIPNFETELSREVVEYCFDAQEEFDVSATLLMAIVETESHGDATVVSDCGAIGLMQIMPQYNQERLKELGGGDLYDPRTNIRCGASLLLEYFEQEGDIELVLAKYRGKYSQRYIDTILEKQEQFEEYMR